MKPTAGIAAISAFCLPLCAQHVPEVEPNDTVAQAQPIVAGRHVVANLVAGEQDWYSFTLASPALVQLRTSGNFAVNPSVDTVVFLFDATGTARLAWDDRSVGQHSVCGATLPAGTYTCQVIGKLATTAGDYGLDFTAVAPRAITVVEGPEPNGDPALAGTPTPFTPGDTIEGDLSSPTDSDWYVFALTTRAIVQAVCYDDGGVPQLDATLLRFYQETSPGVFAAFGTTSTITTSHRAFNLAHPQTLLPGNYAIEVVAGTAATGTPPFDYQKVGKYSLRTAIYSMPGTGTVAEGPEPNNAPGLAPFFSLGDTLTGFCSGGNEEDWWAFAVGAPTTVAFMSDNGLPNPITDTSVKVYDDSGTALSTASSGGPSSHGRLIFTLPQAGIYYVAVAGGLFAATGDYVVYTGGADAMYVPSTFSQQPPSTNACPGSNALRPALLVQSGEAPAIGSTCVLRLQNALANAVAVPFFGFSRTLANGGTIPLPYDLTTAGAPGCFVRVDPMFPLFVLCDASGVAYVDLILPPTLSMRGLIFYCQSIQIDLPLNPLGASLSNDVKLQLGDRPF
ncbi:MAG: PPC domain-containing protein [Planctomycetota bacterium]